MSNPTVYFVGSEEGPVKIGFTTELPNRLRSLRNSSPVPLKLLASIPGTRETEKEYHCRFSGYRLHGEWFERSEAIEDEIGTIKWVRPLVENIKRFAEQNERRKRNWK